MRRSNDFTDGVKHAVRVFCAELELEETTKSYQSVEGIAVTEDWFGHLIAKNGTDCDCVLRTEDDNEGELPIPHWYVSPCAMWRDSTYRRAWYCEWFGITLEQLAAAEKAEREAAAMDDKVARRRRIAYHKAEIERELADLHVSITLPPH